MRKILKSTLKKEKAVRLFKKRSIVVFNMIFVHFTPIFAAFHIVFTQILRRFLIFSIGFS